MGDVVSFRLSERNISEPMTVRWLSTSSQSAGIKLWFLSAGSENHGSRQSMMMGMSYTILSYSIETFHEILAGYGLWLASGSMAESLVKNDPGEKKEPSPYGSRSEKLLDKKFPDSTMVSEWKLIHRDLWEEDSTWTFTLEFGTSHSNDLFHCKEPSCFPPRAKGNIYDFHGIL